MIHRLPKCRPLRVLTHTHNRWAQFPLLLADNKVKVNLSRASVNQVHHCVLTSPSHRCTMVPNRYHSAQFLLLQRLTRPLVDNSVFLERQSIRSIVEPVVHIWSSTKY